MIDLLSNSIWSEADIVAHGRAVIAGHVSEPRQNELRTIMLGHIAGMRTASMDELAEIGLVQTVTEAQVLDNTQARADNALLIAVLAHEAALARLAQAEVTEDVEAIAQDITERNEATAAIAGATQPVLDLLALRHPVEPEVLP